MSSVVTDESWRHRTKDLNQAAFLWCQEGVTLADVSTDGRGSTVYFTFSIPMRYEAVTALLLEYANGSTKVDPKLFSGKQADLRDLLHACLEAKK
jgi:hypothetical protein